MHYSQDPQIQKNTNVKLKLGPIALFTYIKIREMLYLQHFYNKSQVVSYYWFKFETNTKITFLP